MASKVKKSKKVDIQGVLDLTDGIIKVNVEDVAEPFVLTDLVKEFDGVEVKISFTENEDLA